MNTLARLSAILFYTACLHADDKPKIDADLPQPLSLEFADTLVSQSPFTRSVNLEESLQLTGLAYIDGRPVATITNRATKEMVVVSDQPNAMGWKLLEAVANVDLSNTEVQLMVGPEIITMHYNNSQLEPKPSAKGGSASHLANSGTANKTEHFHASSLLGERGHDLYVSLSAEGRTKFKELVKAYVDKRPDATPEQSSAYAQKIFSRIQATDQQADGGGKAAKVGKPNKKK